MTGYGFPVDDYTPHGYLANPFAVAHSWSDSEGGCLRSSRDDVGFGWQLPWALRAQASVDLVVTLESGGQRLNTREDFDAAGLMSPHHSANLFVYRWQAFGRIWEAAYVLVEQDTLGVEVSWVPLPDAAALPDAGVGLVLPATRDLGDPARPGVTVDPGKWYGRFELWADQTTLWVTTASGAIQAVARRSTGPAPTSQPPLQQSIPGFDLPMPMFVPFPAHEGGGSPVTAAIQRARREDDAFWNGATRLEGDWPASWRRGWVYDTETTRMCVYPPGGIFTDVWPAWMIQWPRAVVAEGTLDMARFAYASPDLAQRALLSLFRDAEAPNVPCVFQHGEPNMVASDGSICGTSPAWCVPFYNLERLFSLTLDRDWLAAIYPYLKRYLEWWLAERTDPGGWAVYKCTWEAGEDDTPRLDPERRGDHVVSAFVRPVELQAMMALSAGVMWRFALVLGETDDHVRWRKLEAEYLERTRQLWDPEERRFRDWDARAGRFVAPAPNEPNYWGIDPCRYSALAFTPLLAGIVDDETRAGLRDELQEYDGPPWTLWASWSYVILEAAPSTGDHSFAGQVAAGIVGRVYDELDARTIADPRHPTPGVAREYWPLNLDTWASCEGYSWGANTASMLVRQIFGFLEGLYFTESNDFQGLPDLDAAAQAAGWRAPSLTFELWPSLPADFLVPGREYWLTNVPYRGGRLALGYRVGEADALTLLIAANVPTRASVVEASTRREHASDGLLDRHEVSGRNGEVYTVELRPV